MVVSKAEVGEVAVLDVFLLTMQLIGGGGEGMTTTTRLAKHQ